MIGDELAKDLDALIAEAKAQPPVTAPTPERRVGEAGKVYVTVDGLRELHGHAMSVGTVDQWCKVALDFAEQSSAEVARLTAEVERLRAAVTLHADGLERAGQGYFAQSLRAALSLPTPAPEDTDG